MAELSLIPGYVLDPRPVLIAGDRIHAHEDSGRLAVTAPAVRAFGPPVPENRATLDNLLLLYAVYYYYYYYYKWYWYSPVSPLCLIIGGTRNIN